MAADEHDLVRALANLIHNGIKYTWRRERAQRSWVTIRSTISEGMVDLVVENWGVPIAREELDRDLVFQIGYRGKWSTDRGRSGTGIGLSDARRVAENHDGELLVESRPAAAGRHDPDSPGYYQQPFLTTVTLRLPLADEWESIRTERR